jgi:hypothetical protein
MEGTNSKWNDFKLLFERKTGALMVAQQASHSARDVLDEALQQKTLAWCHYLREAMRRDPSVQSQRLVAHYHRIFVICETTVGLKRRDLEVADEKVQHLVAALAVAHNEYWQGTTYPPTPPPRRSPRNHIGSPRRSLSLSLSLSPPPSLLFANRTINR